MLLHCQDECTMVWPTCKTVWQFLTKLSILLPYDPVLMRFDIHPKELKTYVQIKTYIDVYKSFIHNCQHLETTNTSFSILMNG